MKILVTGATGFLGQSLCQTLQARGDFVLGLGSRDADLTRSDALEPWGNRRFDQIWHLAAWTQAGDFCLYHPGEQWLKNQQINTTVLTFWQRHQASAKLIAMGTSCAYAPDRPLREEEYLAGEPIDSLYTYAMTKRMLYVGLTSLARQFDLRYLCLAPSTLYGPGYHTDGRQMHFIFDLIRKILRGKLYGEPVVLWGDGEQQRELVYIDDFIRDALWLGDHRENDLVNLGAGEQFSIRAFAECICAAVGYDAQRIQYDTTRYTGAKSKCLDVGKLRGLLPEWRRVPLHVGIQRTVEWFLGERERLLQPARAA